MSETVHLPLHAKPICARAARALMDRTGDLQAHPLAERWLDRMVQKLERAALFTNTLLLIPFALLEAIGALTLGILGVAIQRLWIRKSAPLWEKHTVQIISYGAHSFFIALGSALFAIETPDLRLKSFPVLLDHGVHLGSSWIGQTTLRVRFDEPAGRTPPSREEILLDLIEENREHVLKDLEQNMRRDLETLPEPGLRALPWIEAFLRRHPEEREFVETFSIPSFFKSETYREQAAHFLGRLFNESDLLGFWPASLSWKLPSHQTLYQDYLLKLFHKSRSLLSQDPALHQLLNEREYQGKELLEMMDPAAFVPLSHFTQYQELLQPIRCPKERPRRKELETLRAELQSLSSEKREELVQKIFKGSSLQASSDVHAFYLKLCRLATPLYQDMLKNISV